MKPFYEDGSVKLYEGRCEDILPGLSLTGSVHLLTDPPYFKVKDNDWDNQWGKAAEFLDWMGEWLDLAKPLLSADASVWVFASPQLTSAVESVIARRFRVLNSVRWAKEGGDNLRRVSLPLMRSFVSIWEGIIFAEQLEDEALRAIRISADRKWREHRLKWLGAVGRYLSTERTRAGKSQRQISEALQSYANPASAAATVRNWELSKNLVTPEGYRAYRSVCGPGYFTRDRDSLSAEWAAARSASLIDRPPRTANRNGRPFSVTARPLSEDIWRFPSVSSYEGKHPCEKPEGLLTHMIETTTRPGDTILDPFSGSGAVLDVARKLGRKAVGIEMDPHWCKQAAVRLAAQPFDFGEWTA